MFWIRESVSKWNCKQQDCQFFQFYYKYIGIARYVIITGSTWSDGWWWAMLGQAARVIRAETAWLLTHDFNPPSRPWGIDFVRIYVTYICHGPGLCEVGIWSRLVGDIKLYSLDTEVSSLSRWLHRPHMAWVHSFCQSNESHCSVQPEDRKHSLKKTSVIHMATWKEVIVTLVKMNLFIQLANLCNYVCYLIILLAMEGPL